MANRDLEQIIFDIKIIWDKLPPPSANQTVIYNSIEANELIKLLAAKSYDAVNFNTSAYDDIVTEGSSYALQYYVGGIFISIIEKLRLMLSWTCDYDACIIYSLVLLLFIVECQSSRDLLLNGSYVDRATIVNIFLEIYAVARDMHQEVGDEFEALEDFDKIAAYL